MVIAARLSSVGHSRQFMPTFSVCQLRSNIVKDFGAGNMTTFKRLVDEAVRAGITALCLQPLHETGTGMASLFSRTSMNALSLRLLDLKEVPELARNPQLEADLKNAAEVTQSPKANLGMVEVMHRRYMQTAYDKLCENRKLNPGNERKEEFEQFCSEHSWWLDKYAYFKALQEVRFSDPGSSAYAMEYSDMESAHARAFISENLVRIDYYKFVQFEIYRQVKEALAYAHKKGITEIETLVGVGVDRVSAEGFLMPELFDASRQIGCFPEPENGYPIQLWGFLAERANPAMMQFKARSFAALNALGVDRIGVDHACGFLGGYTTFPVYGKDGHVLNASNPADAVYAEEGGVWTFIPKQEEDARKTFAKDTLRALLEAAPGIKFTAETVGDKERREAAEGAIREAIASGADITLMRALPWESTPFSEYNETDRLSLTHDMPALLGLLTGRAGDHKYEWIDGGFVMKLLSRLGILAPHLNGPIDLSQISGEFLLEIQRRIVSGSEAGTVVTPLATLFTLVPKHRDSEKWQYSNVQPGTPGDIGNPMGNWEGRLPAVEELSQAAPQIQLIANRSDRPVGVVSALDVPNPNFHVQVATVKTDSVAYQAASGNWTVWQPPQECAVHEIAVTYSGEHQFGGHENKKWAQLDISGLDLDKNRRYNFLDLVSGQLFTQCGENKFVVGLNKTVNRQHFVVYEDKAAA
ncbi:MAG: 4-alpha-glucanotransferase [Candidatus Margulisiibacteriota bacterium]